MITNMHVIVAPSSWEADSVKYRRHRLAEFLLGLKETKLVIWIAPYTIRKYSISCDFSVEILSNGIVEVLVPDFKSLVSLIPSFQKKINKFIYKYKNETSRLYLWFTTPVFSNLAKVIKWDSIIYDCSDRWSEAAHLKKVKRRLLIKSESRILKSSNLIFCTSIKLLEYLSERTKKEIHLVENGVKYNRFLNTGCIKKLTSNKMPVLGFIGGLKPWKINFDILLALAEKRSDWMFVLIGKRFGEMGESFTKLLSMPNVIVHDAVPVEEVNQYINGFDVGLLPYIENKYNEGVFPLKLFEYLASGIPVVGCGLPSTGHYIEREIYEHVASNIQMFMEACERAINYKSDKIDERRLIASKANWDEKLLSMWESVKAKN